MMNKKLKRIISVLLLTLSLIASPVSKIYTYAAPTQQQTILIDMAHLDNQYKTPNGTIISDNGAPYGNLNEREIVNQISLKLGQELEKLGYKIEYTRDIDKPISISQRVRMANSKEYDYYLSIHGNAAVNKNARGSEIFCNKGGEAEKLATEILKNLEQDLNLINRGVKESPYYDRYIKNTAMIIETGFGTNSDDLNILLNKQDQIVDSIVKSIENTYTNKGISPGFKDITHLSTKVEVKKTEEKRFDMKYNSELKKWEFIEIKE